MPIQSSIFEYQVDSTFPQSLFCSPYVFPPFLFVTTLYNKVVEISAKFKNLTHLWDTYFKSDSKRSVIRQCKPDASFSNVPILGFEFSSINSWIVDFGTPDIMLNCRIVKLRSYIILYSTIFIQILCTKCTKPMQGYGWVTDGYTSRLRIKT